MATSLNAKEYHMKKFGKETIRCILDRAIREFMEDATAPEFVSFIWKGFYVEAEIDWSYSRRAYFVSHFHVVYSRCVMTYNVREDYDLRLAWCL